MRNARSLSEACPQKTRIRRHWKWIIPLIAVSAACGFVALLSGCGGRLFYYPTRVIYRTPAQDNLVHEEVYFFSRDGTRLHGWFVPAAGKAKGTVIHFHGNAQNMTAHFGFVAWLPEEGFNVFVFDYRGYGQSEGHPGRRGVYEDSKAALEYVKSRTDIDQDRLLIFGQSLGGANAIVVIGNNNYDGIKAVVIDSSFCSYRRIVRDKLGAIPIISLLKWPLSFLLITDAYSPADAVGQISPIPTLLIHGTNDRVIPYNHAQLLFDKAKEPKALWTVKGGDHTDAMTKFGLQSRRKLAEFFVTALDADGGGDSLVEHTANK